MAKKITINGSNLLNSLNDDWGGVNNTQQSVTPYSERGGNTPVPAGAEWGINRGEVERFLKAQLREVAGKQTIGTFKVVINQDLQNVMAGFESEELYEEWRQLSDEDKWGEAGQQYLLTYAVLPSAEGSDAYVVSLSLQSSPAQIQPNSNVTINVKGASQVIHPSGQGTEPYNEPLAIQIQTRLSTNVSWQTRGEVTIQANETNWTSISLQPYLYEGMNYVRIRAVGEQATSIWNAFSLNVVNLTLSFANPFATPLTGDTLSLRYRIGGAVSKNIRFEFGTGTGDDFTAQFAWDSDDPTIAAACNIFLGEAIDSTGREFVFTNPTMLNTLLADGVHTVKAQLYSSESVQSEWVENQFMVNRQNLSTPFVAVNNFVRRHENWTEVKLFDWTAYTGGSGEIEVHFALKDEENTTTYLEWTYNAVDGMLYPFTTQIGIELPNAEIEAFGAYMHITDSLGNALAEPIPFTFGNSATNQPKAGADFYLNPSSRNNAEANPNTIINARTGTAVTSEFNGFNFVTDGWMEVNKDVNSTALDAEKVRALHIPANRKLKIQYNPFSDFVSGEHRDKYATFEMDFRTSSIVDDNEPIFTIKASNTDHIGFTLKPTEAYLITSARAAIDDQNVSWAEDRRMHLVVNVQYNITGAQTGTPLNLIRIFLNGIIEREFFYTAGNNSTNGDRFTEAGASMWIGSTSADIDIFGIRCYKGSSTQLSVQDVVQNYKASLGSIAEKVAFNDANNILDDYGNIDYNKCSGKYNVILHTGRLPKYGMESKGETEGVTLDIDIVGDETHSGTLTNLTATGQGTTAMTYYDWNQQYKITDDTVFTSRNETIEPTTGKGYAIQSGEAKAKKLVGKINFASSMQSHKLGLTWIYNDLFKRLVSNNTITEPSQMTKYPEARNAVFEKPFLFFHRETEGSPIVFKYLMTFGAGKGDKPTFGFKKGVENTGNMLMVEGANNDRPLALFQIPWNDDVYYVTKDQDKVNGEAWHYNGIKQLNFGLGETAENELGEYPSNTAAVNAQIAFFNFVYLHYSRLNVFTGNLSSLRASTSVDTTKFYWVTANDVGLSSNQFDLFRYDNITGTWVDAGVAKIANGRYEKLNLLTQYNAFCQDLGITPSTIDTEARFNRANETFQDMRRAHFRARASNHIEVTDALYHSCFVKFYAGTDNRAKNTYYYTDPETLRIRFEADDLDTMIKTNNLGQNRKPYYVEEHDQNQSGEYYWQGEASGFYNLLEETFATEMTTMMYSMMAAMPSMAPEGKTPKGSVIGFHEDYFLSTQDYFPAVAYNAQAQKVYENAAIAQANGEYENGTVQAITQSVGSQRWSEYQWLVDRIMYISSWCEYGEFAGSSSASGGLSWTGTSATYNFTLTPAKWLYPRIGSDSSNFPAAANGGRTRVPAGTPFQYPTIQTQSDSRIFIRGINYLFEIGDMNIAVSSDQGTFDFTGRKLQKITINPNGTDANLFNAGGITISGARNIKEFVVRGVTTLRGAVDLSKCTRLEKIDLRGSEGMAEMRSPEGSVLKYLYLPSTITTLSLVSPASLLDFSIASLANLRNLSISGEAGTYAYNLLNSCINDNAPLYSFTASVEWTDCPISILSYLANLPVTDIRGTIAVRVSDVVTLDLKQTMLKWGDIDDPTNALYITYTLLNVSSVFITGQKYFNTTGTKTFGITAGAGNDVAIRNGSLAVTWSIEANTKFSIADPHSGEVQCVGLNESGDTTRYALTVTVELVDGNTVSATWHIGAFMRLPVRGDFAYADGTFDDEVVGGKTIVGFVYATSDVYEGEVFTYRNVEICSFSAPIITSTDKSINTNLFMWGISQGTSGSQFTEEVVAQMSAASNNATLVNFTIGTSSDTASRSRTMAMVNTANALIRGYITSILRNADISQYQGSVSAGVLSAMYKAKSIVTQLRLPQDSTELADMMEGFENYMVLQGNTNGDNRYRQLFYPAAYAMYLYEPNVEENELLHASYRKNNWYLTAINTLHTLWLMYHASRGKSQDNSISSDYANEDNTLSTDNYPLYSNILKRLEDAGMPTINLGLFNTIYIRSCTENGAYTAFYVERDSGYIGMHWQFQKEGIGYCTAITTFRFDVV